MSGPASSDLMAAVPSDPSVDGGRSEGFAVPEALQQFMVVVPSKIRLVCLSAFILDKCKVRTALAPQEVARHFLLTSNRCSVAQFSRDNKVIVFVSSCEAVEFLHSLLSSVLSAGRKPPLTFLRLHGNMKQEVRAPRCDKRVFPVVTC